MRSNATDTARPQRRDIVVIGYGNPLRGDDGVGRVIAQRLAESDLAQDLQIIITHQLTPELAEPIGRSEGVIFIDAAGDVPVGQFKLAPIVASPVHGRGTFLHHCTPGRVLAIASHLYAREPEAWTISIGGQSWDLIETLSPAQ